AGETDHSARVGRLRLPVVHLQAPRLESPADFVRARDLAKVRPEFVGALVTLDGYPGRGLAPVAEAEPGDARDAAVMRNVVPVPGAAIGARNPPDVEPHVLVRLEPDDPLIKTRVTEDTVPQECR